MTANTVNALAIWPWMVTGEMLKWTTNGKQFLTSTVSSFKIFCKAKQQTVI